MSDPFGPFDAPHHARAAFRFRQRFGAVRCAFFTLALCATSHSSAATREVRVPLVDGSLTVAAAPVIDLNALGKSTFVAALNKALGDGCQIAITPGSAVIRYDTEKLPHDSDAAKVAVRAFTATVAPEATAEQARTFGLLLPKNASATTPTVVLVHGLDSDRSKWSRLADLLAADGFQVAWFSYPSDQPITDSAALLAKHHAALRKMFPKMPLSIVAHSMGSLVTRAYVEGDDYKGGIERLILIAPPNHGSRWANLRVLLEAQEHYGLWRHEPNWSPTWMITDGLGEAGRDLKPDSAFLATLNDRPRRPGVKYTILAGDQHPAGRIGGDVVGELADVLPNRVENLWGFRQTVSGLRKLSDRLATAKSRGDGPVSLDSAKLDGVDDFVVLHGDHHSLYQTINGNDPVGWETIRDRMKR